MPLLASCDASSKRLLLCALPLLCSYGAGFTFNTSTTGFFLEYEKYSFVGLAAPGENRPELNKRVAAYA